MSLRWRGIRCAAASVLVAGVLGPAVSQASATAAVLPTGFQEKVVFSGLNQPTNIEFAPDGRIFVAEKGGLIKVFDNLADQTPTVFADLSTNVHNQWDRGLLGMALAPNFPANPWVYVLYTYDAPPGQTAPVWHDVCPDANNGACVVTGRLSKLQASGNVMTGTEQVLIHDWCQQYPSHSIGDLHFGADGMLYVTGGDGASFSATDYGQLGNPINPCGDPPGGAMTPPTAEGGALRSQDVRTTTDPTGLNGAVLRLDPTTGAGAPGNPMAASADLNARRIVAYGLRNPFRFTIRPGTNEAWVGDVGWNTWEDVERLVDPTAATATNFGWPCYEGAGRMSSYDNANLNLCESLYSGAGQTAPYFTYQHGVAVQGCGSGGGSSVTGAAFYPTGGGPYPAAYRGALFFADYSRGCIWAMQPSTAGGLPSPSNIITFVGGAASPVDLAVGPGNELYYVDLGGGTVRVVRYFPGNQPPTAVRGAVPTSGAAPLTVNFSATSSTDPDPIDQGRLTYAWDFTDNGSTDSTSPTASFVYSAGTYTARLTVTDTLGVSDSETVVISSGNSAPTAVMDTPSASLTWAAGDTVSFSGHATDPQQGTLPASALHWKLRMQHCPAVDSCHTHFLQEWDGVASGSFAAPDHEYPSYLELELIATDAQGLTHNVVRRLDPKTVNLSFASSPSGLQLTVGPTTQTTPFTRTVIQGSTNSVSAPTPQTAGTTTYTFGSWSDGGAQTHVIVAPATPATYTATYTGSAPTCSDAYGYSCVTETRAFVPADQTVLSMTGDEALAQVSLPFGFPFYGQPFSSAWVSSNGFLSFTQPSVAAGTNSAVPSAAMPNAAVYAFWDDLVVKSGTSTVRTAVLGTAPNRQFVVEWRLANVYQTSSYLSTEVILYENGQIVVNYNEISLTNTREQGSSATVGIENATGDVAIQYALNQPVLRNGTAVVYTPPGGPPPAAGTVQGTVTNAATTAPIAGATVTLNPGGRSTTTNTSGGYAFADVPAGSYTVAASAPGGLAGSATVTVDPGSVRTVNLALASAGSYTMATQSRPFVPADQTVLPLTGDDALNTVSLPFPVTFYGQTYNTAYVSTNGWLSFVSSTLPVPANVALPDPNTPNAAVYGFWDDLVVKAGTSTVRTALVGTAPNRQFVVEWRNTNVYRTSSYLTMEIVISEGGEIAVNYADISTNTREQGDGATVGIENANGDVALQYTLNQPVLRNGTAVVFRPAS